MCETERRACRRAAATLGLILAVLLPFAPSSAAELWKDLLKQQLWDQNACELNYLTNERWFELQGKSTVMARAHCKDDRQFDVEWREEKQTFAIRLCEPRAC
ncbi:MAG: hypothetical protein ACR2PO_10465 [Methyloligellaceae bacterium]